MNDYPSPIKRTLWFMAIIHSYLFMVLLFRPEFRTPLAELTVVKPIISNRPSSYFFSQVPSPVQAFLCQHLLTLTNAVQQREEDEHHVFEEIENFEAGTYRLQPVRFSQPNSTSPQPEVIDTRRHSSTSVGKRY